MTVGLDGQKKKKKRSKISSNTYNLCPTAVLLHGGEGWPVRQEGIAKDILEEDNEGPKKQ